MSRPIVNRARALRAEGIRKLYLAGPMTGRKDHNFPAFDRSARLLSLLGFSVYNPAEEKGERGWRYEDFLRAGLKALLDCDAVALLPGWQTSFGATLEASVARALKMPLLTTDLRPVEDEPVTLEAHRLVAVDRRRAYDHPFQNFSLIARLWSLVLKAPVSPEQVGLCMILLKVARESWAPKRDNRVDIAGYAECLEMVHREKERRAQEAL